MFEQTFFFFCLPDSFFFKEKKKRFLFTSVLQDSSNNEGINRCHSEWRFGNMTMFTDKSCAEFDRSHRKTKTKVAEAVKFWTIKFTHYMISVVVYIYYKCTKTLIN